MRPVFIDIYFIKYNFAGIYPVPAGLFKSKPPIANRHYSTSYSTLSCDAASIHAIFRYDVDGKSTINN